MSHGGIQDLMRASHKKRWKIAARQGHEQDRPAECNRHLVLYYCSVFVTVGEPGESDFQEWEIDRNELESMIKRIESGEVRCPDLGNNDASGFVSGSSLFAWLKKLVDSSPDSSCVTIDWV